MTEVDGQQDFKSEDMLAQKDFISQNKYLSELNKGKDKSPNQPNRLTLTNAHNLTM